MRYAIRAASLACAGVVLHASPASAHAVAGARVFPVTLTLDDPGVADEASLPTLTWQRSGADGGTGPLHEYDLGVEYDKRITPDFALIANSGYDIFQTDGSKTQAGFENLFITAKYQVYVNAGHEFIASLGVIREFGRTGTEHTGDDEYGSTAPTGYFGKGLGDLPIGLLRPFAVTGELSYRIADRELKSRPFRSPPGITGSGASQGNGIAPQYNSGASNGWAGGLSLQYSLPYLQSQVRDLGLPHWIGGLVPLVEITWTSPASSPSNGGTTWTVAPGVIYLGQTFQFGIEALIPANKAAGANVGAIAQMHFFLDDIFPHSLGKPIFN